MKTAVWKMNSVESVKISVELVKYTPEEIYKEISNILNGFYERNDTRIKL